MEWSIRGHFPTIGLLVWIIFFVVKENQSQDGLLDRRIYLFLSTVTENNHICEDVSLNGKDTFMVRGKVNNSGSNLISVKFEKKYAQSSQYELHCLIIFAQGCHNDTDQECYCQSTNDKDVYDLVFNLNVNANDSQGKVRATMLIYNQDKISSAEITLPRFYDINALKINLSLEVDGHHVSTTNCSVTVSGKEIKLRYNLNLTPFIPNQLFIAYRNNSYNFSDQTDFMLALYEKNTEVKTTLGLTLKACNKDLVEFFCDFYEDFFLSESKIYLYLCIAIFFLSSSSLFAIFRFLLNRRRKNKQSRKARHNDVYKKVYYTKCLHQPLEKKNSILRNSTKLSVNEEIYREEIVPSTSTSDHTKINLILIGNSEEANSSIVKTTLGLNAFHELYTVHCSKVAKTNYNGRLITVLENPALNYKGLDEKNLQKLHNVTEDITEIFKEEFLVFVLVLRLDTLKDSENLKTLINLKKIFGEHTLRHFSIIVLTHDEKFGKNEHFSTLEWFLKQPLVTECGMRVALFDNVTKDNDKKMSQLKKLISMADQLQLGTNKYSDICYNIAEESSKKYTLSNEEIRIHKPSLKIN